VGSACQEKMKAVGFRFRGGFCEMGSPGPVNSMGCTAGTASSSADLRKIQKIKVIK